MAKAQRVVLILYCLLVVYCCVWVPWHVVQSPGSDGFHQWRVGYNWLWSGPPLGDVDRGNLYGTPDLAVIGLRLLAATALAGAGLAATWRYSRSTRYEVAPGHDMPLRT
jgi:hypothetical protein